MTHMAISDPVARTRAALMSNDAVLSTPFGLRPLLYADYAASGRGDARIDAQLEQLTEMYANPHTDDSATGRASTGWLKRADAMIRRAINASEDDVVLGCGTGATGAIERLQQILGLYEAPASREAQAQALRVVLGEAGAVEAEAAMAARAPVVFIGPYEHHSNELTWRESRAHLVRIGLCADGGIDYAQLEQALADTDFADRRKIGAFSAASNVTGLKTDVPRLARLMHQADGILCLDCAASAPYLPIDMNPASGRQDAPDAVYFSPHKFIGGPGACGVLAFRRDLYRSDLPPSLPGGGTVSYVTPDQHDFIEDIAARERAGTPGVMQMVRAALAFNTLGAVGYDVIEAREQAALKRALSHWSEDPAIEVLGPSDPERRIGIVAFNIRIDDTQILHPRYVATLLNDLFGIQSRAGCSCAGPYGHALLDIEPPLTDAYRQAVLSGYAGLRPGWCRLSLHWIMDDDELDYMIEAVRFVAAYGVRFLPLYTFDVKTGGWRSRNQDVDLGLISNHGGAALRESTLKDAYAWVDRLGEVAESGALPAEVEMLRRFPVPA